MDDNTVLLGEVDKLLELSTKIVVAYVSNNTLKSDTLPDVINTVHSTLNALQHKHSSNTRSRDQKPAVSIKKSITDDYLICLEDGKKLKMLKRYIRTHYNLSPHEYRVKWGLPNDYPMVSPNYAARRSDFAKKNGLGKKNA